MAKTIIYEWFIETGFANSIHHGEWEFEEKPTEGELQEFMNDELSNYINASWKMKEEE